MEAVGAQARRCVHHAGCAAGRPAQGRARQQVPAGPGRGQQLGDGSHHARAAGCQQRQARWPHLENESPVALAGRSKA